MRWYLIRHETYGIGRAQSETKLEPLKTKKSAIDLAVALTKIDSVKVLNIVMLYFDPIRINDRPEVTDMELVIQKGSFDLVEKTAQK